MSLQTLFVRKLEPKKWRYQWSRWVAKTITVLLARYNMIKKIRNYSPLLTVGGQSQTDGYFREVKPQPRTSIAISLADIIKKSGKARQKYFETGEVEYELQILDINENSNQLRKEAYDYYWASRRMVPNYENPYMKIEDIKNDYLIGNAPVLVV